MPGPTLCSERARFILWAALPVLVALFFRLHHLDDPEPFVDEGANILTSLDRRVAAAFEPLAQGRPWLVYLFRPVGWLPGDALFTARLMSVGAALASLAALGWTLHLLAGRTAALCGLWLWAVLPFAVFHERLALQDPFVTALLAWTVALMTAGSRAGGKRDWLWFGAAGGLFGCAFLLKVSAAVALPWLGILYLAGQHRAARPWLDRRPVFIALGAIAPLLTLGSDLFGLGNGLDRYSAFPALTATGYLTAALERLQTWLGWYAGYGGWPLLLFSLLAATVCATRRQGPARAAAIGWLAALLATTLCYHNLNARYILSDHLLLVLVLALAIGTALDTTGWRRTAVMGLLLLGLGRWAVASWLIGAAPEQAAVPASEIRQYHTGPWSGRGVGEIRRYLTNYADRHGVHCLVLTHRFLRPGCYGLMLAELNDSRLSVAPLMIYEAEELEGARSALKQAANQRRVACFLLYEGSLYPAQPWLGTAGSRTRLVREVERCPGEKFTLYQFEL